MSAKPERLATARIASRASRAWARLAIAWAWLFLVIGCGASLVPLVRGDYSGVLLAAIGCAVIAAVLLTFGIWRGGIIARIFAWLGIAPLLFIVSEFIGRYRA